MIAQRFETTSADPSVNHRAEDDVALRKSFFNLPSNTLPVPKLVDYLVGTWMAERELVDHGRHQRGSFLGEVVIVDQGLGHESARLSYFERGTLSMGTYIDESTRTLELRIHDDKGADVHFADGRFFHYLDLRDGFCRVTHVCGDDHYVGLFSALSPQRLNVQWQILGPEKDLASNTTLRRVSEND